MAAERPVFGLVHGAWHGAWCWSRLQQELSGLGYASVAMDLPIDDPRATFDDYAACVADSLVDQENVVLVGHSRAGNVVPRAAGQLTVRQLIYLCAAFDPVTIDRTDGTDEVPPRFSDDFLRGIVPLEGSLTAFDPDLARQLFFHDCPSETQDWAVSRLRPQRRASEPRLAAWPEQVSQASIVCSGDRVVNPEWSRYVATRWLGVNPIEFPSGHSPFLAKPQQLARLLVSLVE